LIAANIQNDRVYVMMDKQECKLKELGHLIAMSPNVPSVSAFFLLKSLNIHRSLLIHTLACIHTQSLNPQLKKLKDELLPFMADCIGIVNEYQHNQPMGA
jgi:hypothetical protein